MKFLIPIFLILISGAGFFVLVAPKYENISLLRTEVKAYKTALDNSEALERERNKLVTKYNNMNVSDLARLQKLLPDNIDNIRVILEIERLARVYGMSLKDIRYDDKAKEDESSNVVEAGVVNTGQNQEYGSWNLEFATEGSYDSFISLLQDIEKNLRLVDVVSVNFSSAGAENAKQGSTDNYKYVFKIKTYWLKK